MPLAAEVDILQRSNLDPVIGAAEVTALVRFVLDAERQTGPWEIAVVLTDDAELRRLHREFMGLDEETDVMTFPASDDVPGAAIRGGDIVLSVERAAEQGPAHGHTTVAEVHFLIAHGVLHLCGWDDASDEARTAMLARQAELIARFQGLPAVNDRGGETER